MLDNSRKMKSKTEKILVGLNVLVWIVFIGLLVETGAILSTSVVSLAYPNFAKNLYMDLNLHALRESDIRVYTLMVVSILLVLICKVYTSYLVLKVFKKLDLAEPFKIQMAKQIERISLFVLATWLLSVLAESLKNALVDQKIDIHFSSSSGEFLFLAGVIYLIAQIFKRGIEIQSENELTV